MSSPRKLFDLPLGSRFRYDALPSSRVYVLLDRGGSGRVGSDPALALDGPTWRQELFSAAESHDEFRKLQVHYVPVVEVAP